MLGNDNISNGVTKRDFTEYRLRCQSGASKVGIDLYVSAPLTNRDAADFNAQYPTLGPPLRMPGISDYRGS